MKATAILVLILFTAPGFRRAVPVNLGSFRIVDGDTFVYKDVKYRLVGLTRGVDTPETNIPCQKTRGLAAKARLLELLAGGEVHLTRRVRGPDKYGRVLAALLVSGNDVAEVLISEGHAQPYDGGRRPTWCQGQAQP